MLIYFDNGDIEEIKQDSPKVNWEESKSYDHLSRDI